MNQGLALVTGATGFVGSNVARLLLEQGYEVRCLVRPAADRGNLPRGRGVQLVEGDLRDLESLRKAVIGCDELFHVAADYRFWSADPRQIYACNVEGTRNILRCAADAGMRKIVYTSTVGTIGLGGTPAPAHEQSPAVQGQFDGHYKSSKLQAEEVALDFARRGLPIVIVNPSTPIGPWDCKPTPTGKIIVDFMKGRLPAYVDTGLNFVHVRDVAWGHLLASQRGRFGERYILGNSNLSMLEFLKLLADLSGRRAPWIRVPYGLAWVIGWMDTRVSDWVTHRTPAVPLEAVRMSRRKMYFDSSKAIRELGFPQTPIRKAASEALSWFAQLERGARVWEYQ